MRDRRQRSTITTTTHTVHRTGLAPTLHHQPSLLSTLGGGKMAPKLPHPLAFGGKTGRDPLDEPSCIIALREGHDSFPIPVEISFCPSR